MQGADVVDRANETIEFHSFWSAINPRSLLILRAVFMWLMLGV